MLAKLNIRSTVLVFLLGILINNGFSKTVGFSSGFIELTPDTSLLKLEGDTTNSDSIIDSDISKNAPKFKVKYIAKDSIDFDNTNQIVYLFGEAKVEYDKINLEADRIMVFIGKNEVHAFGKRDSTGKLVEKVKFKDEGEEFEAPEMAYNFNTKKGRIIQATTQQGEMFLLSDKGKKMPNNDIFLKTGKITTCDAEHPHFYFEASKLKVVPGKKIVVGPTNLIIRELRTPLWIPFGMFPNNQKRQSGIIIPGYGENNNQFGLTQLGFHWAMNDYVHATILGDIFFSGTYRLNTLVQYKKKYKYAGKVQINYNNTETGTKGLSDENSNQSLQVYWDFRQDSKAHPKSNFSAKVDVRTSGFNQSQNLNQNTSVSSVQAFNKSQLKWGWREAKWNLNVISEMDQYISEGRVDLKLPQLSLNINPRSIGKFRASGSFETLNKVSRGDSVFFQNETFDAMRNGARANVRVSVAERLTLAKYINVTMPTLTWNSYFITEELRKIQGVDGLENDTMDVAKYSYDMSLGNFGLNTKIFGTYKFKEGMKLKGFRHTITPSATLTWRPEWFVDQNGNTSEYDAVNDETIEYNKYSHSLYQPRGSEAASVNFSIDQNLQTKVRDSQDSSGTKYNNLNIINSFRVSSAHNFLADSMKWSDASFSLNTSPGFLKNLSVSGRISPYAIDNEGNKYDRLLWEEKKLGRLTSFQTQARMSLKRLNFMTWFYNKIKLPKDDFDWSMNLAYTYRYNKNGLVATTTQSLGIDGSVGLSKNWRFSYNLPVNLDSKELSSNGNFNFTRKLHCWEMTFNWYPFRDETYYTFTIRPKAGILQDLKYDKSRQGDRVN